MVIILATIPPRLFLQVWIGDVNGSSRLLCLELHHAARAPCRAHQGWGAPRFHDERHGVFGDIPAAIQGRAEALLTRRRRAQNTWRGCRTRRSGLCAVCGRLARRRRCQWIRGRAHIPSNSIKRARRGTIYNDTTIKGRKILLIPKVGLHVSKNRLEAI